MRLTCRALPRGAGERSARTRRPQALRPENCTGRFEGATSHPGRPAAPGVCSPRRRPMLGRFFRLLLALLVSQILLFVLFVVTLGAILSARERDTPVVHRRSVLSLQLTGELPEYPTLPVLPFVNEVPLSQTHVLECLERAARDDRINAVLLELDAPILGWGMACELREALARFRQSGKQVWAHGDYLDEVG